MGRSRERLDPVRWRAPGRGSLLRLTVITALLATAAAAVLVWSRSPGTSCTTAGPAPAKRSSSPRAPVRPSASPAPQGRPPIPDGTVGVPVRLADPTALALVHPGNRVDLIRLGDRADGTPIASAALVLDVTGADDPASGGLLLALGPAQAQRALTPPGSGFAILIRPG
ncbi:hypothetical protein ACWT_7684 [Actinoplanes sp. SE50]|uniref:hypothetical protein n=1 Tax=unclassified Actinoplanes TaxID=2626549 RepID=UPI00023EDE11|nr:MULTISPECIES: hypothetical protein [unclassified Actinoplanes]AEV88695.1 hypothetical protein ACPL_7815 [Actinoplanes sp. SE50/110]ATO87099.1 hypothetical protein ACWT_7684 [Actinoplanes sp. SE50]SLM04517.1 hypothetical protein ACSP50_7824 [Actinoplanes sp. SE50/110]